MSALWIGHKVGGATGSAIMESVDDMSINDRDVSGDNPSMDTVSCQRHDPKSFLLIDAQESLKVSNAEEFMKKLTCRERDHKVKVISIFGNTGDGKSHTLNQTFFRGREIFKTSNEQNSYTLGVWAAFDPVLKIICLDTEGTLGFTSYKNEHTRLSLKVLAVSDVVVYRTCSERLNKDLFMFLGAASRAYSDHFQAALRAVGHREGATDSLSALGPSIIILHETRHTRPLSNNGSESVEDILKNRFAQLKLETEAFSSIKYVGLQRATTVMDYEPLRMAVKNELNNTAVRSARQPYLVYDTLKILNDKFSRDIGGFSNILFPDQYFTCPVKCLSCGCRCSNSMGHLREGKPHSNNSKCRYQRQYENLIYICNKCYADGNEMEVSSLIQTQDDNTWYGLAKYAWSGYAIVCPHCGVIYRSRQYWYGNKNPEDDAVRTEVAHIWNVSSNVISTPQNTAQRMVDGVSYITEAVTNVSLQPTKALSAWVTDQVAPTYWRPNHEIKHCHKCKTPFGISDTKHHCRACGEGFCAQCSSQKKCVPARNWYTPVRVCDLCYLKDPYSNDVLEASEDVNARKVTEHVVSTLSAVGTVLNYSKSFIKDTVRPSYWIPDSEIVSCCVCDQNFSAILPLHHCRDCGRGVCQECSHHRKPVPHRGWDKPVRVCDSCMKID